MGCITLSAAASFASGERTLRLRPEIRFDTAQSCPDMQGALQRALPSFLCRCQPTVSLRETFAATQICRRRIATGSRERNAQSIQYDATPPHRSASLNAPGKLTGSSAHHCQFSWVSVISPRTTKDRTLLLDGGRVHLGGLRPISNRMLTLRYRGQIGPLSEIAAAFTPVQCNDGIVEGRDFADAGGRFIVRSSVTSCRSSADEMASVSHFPSM